MSGWAWAIVSLLFWSLWAILYSRALDSYSYPAIYVAGATVASAISWVFVLGKQSPAFPSFGLAWLLPLIGLAGSFTQAKAFEGIPTGTVTAILALNPVVVSTITALSGERITATGWLGMALCVAGVALIALTGRG